MFNRRLLFLTRDRLTAFRWRKGGVDGPPRRFSPDAKGREEFTAWVGEEPDVPVYILADYIEEEFKNESQPHVLGPDRNSLIELRMNRSFPATPYRYARIVGRSRDGRRDDLTLLAGLTEPGSVSAWIDILMEKQAPLAGIFSLPLVSAQLLKRLRVHTPSTLLVTLQSSSGLRFSYFHGAMLKVSRMAPVPDMEPGKYVALFRSELEKTRGYLGSLRLLPKETPLMVVVLTNLELSQALEPHCQESATTQFKLVAVGQAANKIGIKRAITTPFSDSLFIQLLGMHPGFNHYATPAQIGFYYTRLLRKIAQGAAWTVGALCLLLAGTDLYQGVTLMLKSSDAREQTVLSQKRFRQAMGSQTQTSILPSDVRGAVELVEQLEARRADPREVMLLVSSVLEGFREIVLEKRFLWSGPIKGGEFPVCKGKARKKTTAPVDEATKPVRQYGEIDVRVNNHEKVEDPEYFNKRLEAFAAALLARPEVVEVCLESLGQKKAEEALSLSAKVKEVPVEGVPFTVGVLLRVGKEAGDAAR